MKKRRSTVLIETVAHGNIKAGKWNTIGAVCFVSHRIWWLTWCILYSIKIVAIPTSSASSCVYWSADIYMTSGFGNCRNNAQEVLLYIVHRSSAWDADTYTDSVKHIGGNIIILMMINTRSLALLARWDAVEMWCRTLLYALSNWASVILHVSMD